MAEPGPEAVLSCGSQHVAAPRVPSDAAPGHHTTVLDEGLQSHMPQTWVSPPSLKTTKSVNRSFVDGKIFLRKKAMHIGGIIRNTYY